jgi:DUF971 family protein
MSGARPGRPWPTDINLNKSARTLTVTFDDGAAYTLPAELLRVESPSAEVQGHGGEQKKTVPGKRKVVITDVEPVGTYALRIIFSDGHDSGLYTWDYLYELGRDADFKMTAYLRALDAKGLRRD